MDDDQGVAAALVVAVEAGLLSTSEAVHVLDREISRRDDPAGWLIDASLATVPEDVLHALRTKAADHPMLRDGWVFVEAMGRALQKGASAMDVALRVEHVYPYGHWPSELKDLLYDVYEEVTCAHAHGGVPQPQHVQRTLQSLVAAAIGKSAWRGLLERVASEAGAAEQ